MDENQLNSILKEEYILLQQFYEDFDRRALLIKGWSVTISLGGLALGFERQQPIIWIVAGFAGLLFWLIDAKWRTYQYANQERIKLIEAYFRGENKKDIIPLQIYSFWWKGYKAQSLFGCIKMPLVFLPHVIAVLAAIILVLVHYFLVNLIR